MAAKTRTKTRARPRAKQTAEDVTVRSLFDELVGGGPLDADQKIALMQTLVTEATGVRIATALTNVADAIRAARG